MGHLGGSFEKHFTQEACPLYHNVSIEETKRRREIRLRDEDERQKSSISHDPMSTEQTADQKQYQIDIEEMRAQFVPRPAALKIKTETDADDVTQNHKELAKDDSSKSREPSLDGLACDYDMQLFLQAQAIASEKIETDLMKYPAERGTKYDPSRNNSAIFVSCAVAILMLN